MKSNPMSNLSGALNKLLASVLAFFGIISAAEVVPVKHTPPDHIHRFPGVIYENINN